MENKGAVTYIFGPFHLEVERNRLLLNGELVQLRRKSYEILLLLVENAGSIITKEEIISHVWPDQTVEENNLTQQIYKLRRLLGDTPKDQDYILTIPGKGYLFNKTVQKEWRSDSLETVEADLSTDCLQPETAVEQPPSTRLSLLTSVRLLPIIIILTSIVMIIAIIAFILFRFYSGNSDGAQPKVTPFATLQGIESFPKFSPDGKFLAFTAEGEDEYNRDIYIKMVNQGEIIRVTSHPDDDEQAVWSPDGRKLAFLRKSRRFGEQYKLIIVAAFGGPEQEITEVLGGLDWSPDGSNLAVSSNEGPGTPTGIYLVSPDGQQRRLISKPPQDEVIYDTYPVFSSDGKKIAFVRWSGEQVGDLCVIDLTTGLVKQVTNDKKRILAVRWAPGNQDLLYVSNRNGNQRLWQIPVAGGETVMVTSVPGEVEHFDILRDGKILAYTQMLNDTTIRVETLAERSGGGAGTLNGLPCTINSSRTDESPQFSPDGRHISFVSNRSGWDEIWIANPDCSQATQLTNLREVGVGSPTWSPDGRRIAFDRYLDGQSQIFVINSDGSGIRQLTFARTCSFMPGWSADGKWIYLTSLKFGINQIWKIPVEGDTPAKPVLVTEHQGRNATESSDGYFIYYTRFNRLFRLDLRQGNEEEIPELSEFSVGRYWNLVGNRIFFISHKYGSTPQIHQFDITSRTVQKLRDIDGYLSRFTPGITVSPDQRLIAYSYITYRLGDIMLIEDWR
jgi:Tol biopolymer transport system component/DNA-binding winged helix-turn-helix (wHTH) protein